MPIAKFACRVSLVAAALALPTMLPAQFQPPTPEELSMTTDAQKPGPAAV